MNIDKPILFVSDIDGTLLKNRWDVSDKTRDTINKAIAYKKGKGFKFALATGRPVGHLNQVIKNLSLHDKEVYVVACNGAIVLDIKKNIDLEVQNIERSLVHDIVNFLKKYTNFIHMHTIKDSFRTSNSKLATAYDTWSKYSSKHIEDLEKINDESICKITSFLLSKSKAKQVNEELKKFLKDKATFIFSFNRVFEVMPLGCNKLLGVQRLQNHLGIEDSQVIVVGDNANDVEMLDYYANSYAVKNSSDLAIKAAKHTLEHTNKEDAIANLILDVLN